MASDTISASLAFCSLFCSSIAFFCSAAPSSSSSSSAASSSPLSPSAPSSPSPSPSSGFLFRSALMALALISSSSSSLTLDLACSPLPPSAGSFAAAIWNFVEESNPISFPVAPFFFLPKPNLTVSCFFALTESSSGRIFLALEAASNPSSSNSLPAPSLSFLHNIVHSIIHFTHNVSGLVLGHMGKSEASS